MAGPQFNISFVHSPPYLEFLCPVKPDVAGRGIIHHIIASSDQIKYAHDEYYSMSAW